MSNAETNDVGYVSQSRVSVISSLIHEIIMDTTNFERPRDSVVQAHMYGLNTWLSQIASTTHDHPSSLLRANQGCDTCFLSSESFFKVPIDMGDLKIELGLINYRAMHGCYVMAQSSGFCNPGYVS